jgi:hypothetical protein
MKHCLAVISILGFLYSCNNSSPYKAPDYRTFDTAIYFKGFYVSESYVNKINKYKSPRIAQDSALSVTIPDSTLQTVFWGYNFHEGAGPCIIVKKGNTYEQMDSIEDLAVHKLILDTLHPKPITIISSNKIKIGNEVFDKLESDKVGEELLFDGTYTSQTGSEVEFSIDRKVKGLDNYKTYTVLVDYYDEGLDVDQVTLGTNEKDEMPYAFRFKRDTLSIYELKCLEYDSLDHICGSVDFGKLKYQLVKKN